LITTFIDVKHRIAAVLKELKKLKPEEEDEYKRLRAMDTTKMEPKRARRGSSTSIGTA